MTLAIMQASRVGQVAMLFGRLAGCETVLPSICSSGSCGLFKALGADGGP